MSRVPDLRRIKKEDFPSDQQDLVGRLAFPINSFMEQTQNVLDNRIDFENLNQQLIELDLTVDSSGFPTTDAKFRVDLNSKVAGCICINAQNLVNTTQYPTAQPFINFTQNNIIVTINHISGLQANTKYRLRFLVIGF